MNGIKAGTTTFSLLDSDMDTVAEIAAKVNTLTPDHTGGLCNWGKQWGRDDLYSCSHSCKCEQRLVL